MGNLHPPACPAAERRAERAGEVFGVVVRFGADALMIAAAVKILFFA